MASRWTAQEQAPAFQVKREKKAWSHGPGFSSRKRRGALSLRSDPIEGGHGRLKDSRLSVLVKQWRGCCVNTRVRRMQNERKADAGIVANS